MPRLFVAIDLPEEINEQLADIGGHLDGIRWYDAHQLHMTLKFIGEVQRVKFESIREKLNQINGDAFELTVDGLGYFPPKRHPRVIWAGVQENAKLLGLQQDIEDVLSKEGIEPDNRKFKPHITLGKNIAVNKRKVEQFINDEGHDLLIQQVPVNQFKLYSSELNPQGAIHRIEQIYLLK